MVRSCQRLKFQLCMTEALADDVSKKNHKVHIPNVKIHTRKIIICVREKEKLSSRTILLCFIYFVSLHMLIAEPKRKTLILGIHGSVAQQLINEPFQPNLASKQTICYKQAHLF